MVERDHPRILVVEDQPNLQAYIVETLSDLGDTVEIHTAGDGIEALEKVASAGRPYDLVVCDISMPRMDGALLVREIRMHPQRHIRTLPVILMTAEKDPRVLDGAAAAGANELVTKPIKPATLRQAVTRLLMPPFDVALRPMSISPT